MSRKVLLPLLLSLTLCGCGGRKTGEVKVSRPFPSVQVPSLLTDPEEIMNYVLTRFWDPFLDSTKKYTTDSLTLLGVDRREVGRQVATYASLLENSPLPLAQKSIEVFFDKLEDWRSCRADSLFEIMTKDVSECLYSVNSPLRNEDIYLPFAKRLASSPFTPEELKAGLEHDAAMCGLNQCGTPASDFRFKDSKGRIRTLYSVRADYTVLLFVNPGCHACGDAVAAFSSPRISQAISSGTLAVLDVYIDEDIEQWKKSSSELPSGWISGYDPDGIIRRDVIYNVRAIPSAYLLDSEKRVIMKDAVEQNILDYLTNAIQ